MIVLVCLNVLNAARFLLPTVIFCVCSQKQFAEKYWFTSGQAGFLSSETTFGCCGALVCLLPITELFWTQINLLYKTDRQTDMILKCLEKSAGWLWTWLCTSSTSSSSSSSTVTDITTVITVHKQNNQISFTVRPQATAWGCSRRKYLLQLFHLHCYWQWCPTGYFTLSYHGLTHTTMNYRSMYY